MGADEYSKAKVRAVKVLKGEPREQAEKLGLKPDDIVLVKKGQYQSEPPYKVEKIEGSIVAYLKKNGLIITE
jgi:hypothetical protein